jgi:hypothetical protein
MKMVELLRKKSIMVEKKITKKKKRNPVSMKKRNMLKSKRKRMIKSQIQL